MYTIGGSVMTKDGRKTIAVRESEYNQLRGAKEAVEHATGQKFNWGAFLTGAITGGIIGAVIGSLLKKGKKSNKDYVQKQGD